MKNTIYAIALTICLIGSALGQPATTNSASGMADSYRMSLMELKTKLMNKNQELPQPEQGASELYRSAMVHIEALQLELAKYLPKNGKLSAAKVKEFDEFHASCSLLVEAAMLQIEDRKVQMEVVALHGRRDSIAQRIDDVYGSILSVERGNAARLKANLDQERAKSDDLKLKAEELRRKADELKEEMNKRLGALQSELIKVRKDARGTIVSMSDILFEFDKADLKPDLRTSLAKIAGILSVYKDFNVIVEGFTDNVGPKEYNQVLSEKRAQNVRGFLQEQGVTEGRLKALGYGEEKPVASNNTKSGRQQNRRVDLVISEHK